MTIRTENLTKSFRTEEIETTALGGIDIEVREREFVSIVQNTGANWVFVVDASGEYALRRDIRAGRRNNRYLEIVSGLETGERVITSSYSQMTQVDRVQLTR